MKVSEIKGQLDFFTDALFQTGYDLGWNSVLEEFEQESDREYNLGNTTTAEILRRTIQKIRGEMDDVA